MAARLRARAERHSARAVMAIFAIAGAQSEFDLEGKLCLARSSPDRAQSPAVPPVNSRHPASAGQLLTGNAGDLRPPLPAPIADPVRARRPDQLRRGLDQSAVTRFALAERLLGLVPVVNVNADADPFTDGAALVAQRNRATQMPPVFAVPAPVTMRRRMWRAVRDGLLPGGCDARQVVRMHRRHPDVAESLFDRQPRQLRPVVVLVS